MSGTVAEDDWVADVADHLPVSPLSALGLFLAVVIGVRVAAETFTWRSVFESLFPIVAATSVVVADRWLVANDVSPRDRLTAFAYGLGGFLTASLVTGLHMSVLFLEGAGHHDPLYVSLLSGTVGVAAGTVAGYYEIRQREAVREARRQTDRLEEFASIVSHDLRNPLSVAQGHLQEAFRTGDAAHLKEVDVSLERMDELIEDTLSVARSGTQVTETRSVSLVDLATDAWESVDTGGAGLESAGDRRLDVDPPRAKQLFENLFRNSIEHGIDTERGPEAPDGGEPGGEPVADGGAFTVRVGLCPGGFYVADDGPGIPPDEREAVLDQGYSTTEEGSGLGLAIVRAVAEAHGWGVTVTESEAGGARFEFSRE